MPSIRVPEPDKIPVGQGTLVEGPDVAVAVFNAGGGRFYACGTICPHESGPLAEGWLEGDVVVCPWHGFDFDVRTGRCVVDESLTIPVYAVRSVNGIVEVDVP
jgi:nitrite reductase (NADH) small subunit